MFIPARHARQIWAARSRSSAPPRVMSTSARVTGPDSAIPVGPPHAGSWIVGHAGPSGADDRLIHNAEAPIRVRARALTITCDDERVSTWTRGQRYPRLARIFSVA